MIKARSADSPLFEGSVTKWRITNHQPLQKVVGDHLWDRQPPLDPPDRRRRSGGWWSEGSDLDPTKVVGSEKDLVGPTDVKKVV